MGPGSRPGRRWNINSPARLCLVKLDGFVASAPLRKRSAFVAGNDGFGGGFDFRFIWFPIQFPNTERTCIRIAAARCARVLRGPWPSEKKEGAGKAGCALHPRSRVPRKTENAHEHTGEAEAIRPSLRNGFTAYSALSLVTGLSCHHHQPEVLLPANLTPASGRQDHTASPSASRALVCRALKRPPHPIATFVTIASRPSIG